MKTLISAAALAFALAPAASAQTTPLDECGPLQGTIRVADGDLIQPDMARVSPEDASDAALRAVPDATVTEIELEEEDGFLVYEVDLWRDGVEFEVEVDAGTAEVLCAERD
ncbi:PepSY domain-containing protein [Rubrivirga sp. S365]|uniref:PepSY domain-containing protein n=1 Tax=Rubrivirga litoralis TaxID=3075598 RepID=A0ABU3BNF3_9BACT|nr:MULTISPECIES: PepSY domain-containing protein [unclassified Rubrivirga]MDT0630814.1 PepSY domain-containing protein [Rubrivirga sp. F394]MDT7857366.1 PepSY domain-containing protein [Rubrivirga sp. S365]